MKKITLFLAASILSSATFAQIENPCYVAYCGEEPFDFDNLGNKWDQERQIEDLYKGIPQSFRH